MSRPGAMMSRPTPSGVDWQAWSPPSSRPDRHSSTRVTSTTKGTKSRKVQVMRQGPPDATVAVAVGAAIEHAPYVGFPGSPAGSGRRDQGLKESPSFIGQVTGVWSWIHSLTTLQPPFWNRLLKTGGPRSGRGTVAMSSLDCRVPSTSMRRPTGGHYRGTLRLSMGYIPKRCMSRMPLS